MRTASGAARARFFLRTSRNRSMRPDSTAGRPGAGFSFPPRRVVMARMVKTSACGRPIGRIACLLSLFGGLLTTTPARAAGEPAAEASPPLRVMSFNIRYGTAKDGEDRWEKRKALLLKTIRAFDPDVLGVQEA